MNRHIFPGFSHSKIQHLKDWVTCSSYIVTKFQVVITSYNLTSMKRWNINLIQKYIKNDYIAYPEIHSYKKR